MDERELSLAVVGIDFANPDESKSNRRFEIALCAPGDPVELRPEPRNEHDRRAVAVFSERGIQLGYLTAERCGFIGGKIAAGEEAIASGSEGLSRSRAFLDAAYRFQSQMKFRRRRVVMLRIFTG